MSAIAKTASITLITAVPGSGKTLRAVWYAKQAVEAGETVFWSNINGMAVEGAIEFPDPTKWEELPAGSVLIVDEAQRFFRAGSGSGSSLPSYIAAMETIRHMGIRMILLTQHPALMHGNIRALVGFHEHLVREDGKESATVYTRSRVIDNVRSDKALATEDHHTWAFPKDCYGLYKSAEVHTFKRTIKSKYKRAALLFLLAAVILGFVVWKVRSNMQPPEGAAATGAAAAASQPQGGTGGRGDTGEPRWATPADYARDHLPRFATMPWTMPAFDGRPAVSDPQLYCMAAEPGYNASGDWADGGCSCMTEQGTRYDLGDGECRRVARHGVPYNPYRQPQQQFQPPPQGQPGMMPTGYASTVPTVRVEPPTFGGGDVGTVGAPGVHASYGTITRSAR